MIDRKYAAIAKETELPVRCDKCDFFTTIAGGENPVNEALAGHGYLRELQAEFELLTRLEKILSSFPRGKERFRNTVLIRAAPEMQSILALDSALRRFLQQNSFVFLTRFGFVGSTICKLEEELPAAPPCTACEGGRLLLEPGFFKLL